MIELLASLVLIAPTPGAVDPAQAAGHAPVKKERRICKREITVGTRLAPRTCLTAAQWADAEESRRLAINDELQRAERNGRDAWTPYARPQ